MNTTRKGDKSEKIAAGILADIGYAVAAQARRSPIWKSGVVVGNRGAIDFFGAIDLIGIAPLRPTLFAQVTAVSGISARRAKLRAIPNFSPLHHTVVIMAWDEDLGNFKVFRREADYLDEGWRIARGAKRWPWEETYRQDTL